MRDNGVPYAERAETLRINYLMLKAFIASIIILFSSFNLAEAKTKVYAFYGVGGALFSGGMQKFGKPYQWTQWRQVAKEIDRLPKGTKVVCVGHSMGANACTYIANSVKHKIAFIGGMDPTVWAPINPVKGKAINYYSTNYLNPFGHGKMSGKYVVNKPTNLIHTQITYDKRITKDLQNEISRL